MKEARRGSDKESIFLIFLFVPEQIKIERKRKKKMGEECVWRWWGGGRKN